MQPATNRQDKFNENANVQLEDTTITGYGLPYEIANHLVARNTSILRLSLPKLSLNACYVAPACRINSGERLLPSSEDIT